MNNMNNMNKDTLLASSLWATAHKLLLKDIK
jgi:hypothetical protein